MKYLTATTQEFLAYIKSPVYYLEKENIPNKFLLIWRLFKINLLSMSVVFALYFIFDFVGLKSPEEHSREDKSFVRQMISLIIIAPFFESLVFIFPLKFRRAFFLLLTFFMSIWLIAETQKGGGFINFGISLLLFSACLGLILDKKSEQGWQKNFKWIYWGLAGFLFGFVHLSNYAGTSTELFLWSPILIFHQIFTGLLDGYARMRYGFWYGVILHSLNNCIPALAELAEKYF